MTTTPTIWKSSFIANALFTAGLQTVPQTIGLKNGNILVVWEDTSNINGPSAGIDVVGRIFDPEGNPVGAPFQVNVGITAGDETGPQVVALPDGGFVVAYGGWSQEDGGFIVVQRFNQNNEAVSERFISDDGGALLKWGITADRVGNYTVTFEVDIGDDVDIHSITYNNDPSLGAINAPRQERTNVAQNTDDNDQLAATATFSNGHILTFYTEPDTFLGDSDNTAEFRITDPVTGNLLRAFEIDDSATLTDNVAKDVAVLTGDQFVLVYRAYYNRYAFRVCNSETSKVGPEVKIDTGDSAQGLGGVHVVALQDGGFFIAWLQSAGMLYGQRYGAYGDAIGGRLLVSENASSFGPSRMSLTSDGRILVTYISAGEIAQTILDPRQNEMHGTDEGEVLTAQTTASVIYGHGGDDRLFGHRGADMLDGGAGYDSVKGGGGNDTFILKDLSFLYIIFGHAVFGYDSVIEAAGGGTDTIRVQYVDNSVAHPGSTEVRGYQLTENVENGVIDGTESFNLWGSAQANRLTGNAAANRLDGLGGNDTLIGGAGADTLIGGAGVDAASYANSSAGVRIALADNTASGGDARGDSLSSIQDLIGSAYADILLGGTTANRFSGGIGSDVLRGSDGNDILSGGSGNDVIEGGADYDLINGGEGVDRASYASATAAVVVSLATSAAQDTRGAGTDALTFVEDLWGSAFADTLSGGAGSNTLTGDLGNDRLRGGNGADRLSGGFGADRFIYLALTDSDGNELDRITDLSTEDIIDLSAIDANGPAAGNGAFSRISSTAVFDRAGQLRLVLDNGTTRLMLNTDSDAAAEATILLTGNHTGPTAEDGWLL